MMIEEVQQKLCLTASRAKVHIGQEYGSIIQELPVFDLLSLAVQIARHCDTNVTRLARMANRLTRISAMQRLGFNRSWTGLCAKGSGSAQIIGQEKYIVQSTAHEGHMPR